MWPSVLGSVVSPWNNNRETMKVVFTLSIICSIVLEYEAARDIYPANYGYLSERSDYEPSLLMKKKYYYMSPAETKSIWDKYFPDFLFDVNLRRKYKKPSLIDFALRYPGMYEKPVKQKPGFISNSALFQIPSSRHFEAEDMECCDYPLMPDASPNEQQRETEEPVRFPFPRYPNTRIPFPIEPKVHPVYHPYNQYFFVQHDPVHDP